MQVRAVTGARVSVFDLGEGQVSPTVQLAAGARYAELHNWRVVGSFEDLDVSASVSPWERPDLGQWLGPKAEEWDAMIFSKVDRAFRSIFDCADVARWAEKHRKILAFTEDGIVLNFRDEVDGFATMMAKAFLVIASLFAEMELSRIKSRFEDAHAYLRTTTRWAGGPPPFGYQIVNHPGGEGKGLAVDPVSSEYVRKMAGLIIEGKSQYDVAETLNRAGIPTSYAYNSAKEGAKSKNKTTAGWNNVKVRQILANQACLGYKTRREGNKVIVVRGTDGMPIRLADPIFTEEEWVRLQSALLARTTSPKRTKKASSLLGVAFCNGCASQLYRMASTVKGVTYSYFRCFPGEGKPACPGHSFKEQYLLDILDDQVPQKLAEKQRTRRIFVPGEDHTRELARVKKAMEDIRAERDMEAYDYPGGDAEYRERLGNLVAQRKRLESLPHREDQWIEEPTGETYGDLYTAADREGRRLLCIEAGISLVCSPGRIELRVPTTLDLMSEIQVGA